MGLDPGGLAVNHQAILPPNEWLLGNYAPFQLTMISLFLFTQVF